MNFKVGDIIVNPWVSKIYQGKLNPIYATVYIGNGSTIDYLGRQHKWSTPKGRWEGKDQWKVIGYFPLYGALKSAIGDAVENGWAEGKVTKKYRTTFIDLNQFPMHKRPYSDNYLMSMPRNELIDHIRDIEHNYAVLYEFYQNSIKYGEELQAKLKKELDQTLEEEVKFEDQEKQNGTD